MKQLQVPFPNDSNLDYSIDYLKRKLEREGNTVFCESRIPEGDMIVVTLSYIPFESTDKPSIKKWSD